MPHLKLLTPEKMKLLESTKIKIAKDEGSENVFDLETNEVVLSNNYQQDSRVLYKFVPFKSFGQLLDT